LYNEFKLLHNFENGNKSDNSIHSVEKIRAAGKIYVYISWVGNMCIHLYEYLSMYVCMCVWVYVYLFMYTYIYTYIYI
jgi:hypothetical protein